MKKIKAFLAALVLFVFTAIGLQFYIGTHLPVYNRESGTWISMSKINCYQGLRRLLTDEQTIPVFGSSELKHGQKSGFQADTIFAGSDMEPVFIGEAGYQCLSHAITLGALGDQMQGRKVVLIVSPQWFKKKGVTANAFGGTFSEDNLIGFLKNKNISEESRKYVLDRAKKLTAGNEILNNRISRDERWYSKTELSAADLLKKEFNSRWITNRAESRMALTGILGGVSGAAKEEAQTPITADRWTQLQTNAQTQGEKVADHNELGMYDSLYQRTYKRKCAAIQAGRAKKPDYRASSVEGEDLACFLRICQEEQITPLVLLLPFNGYWYDETGFDADKREAVYDKVREIAAEYDADCADLSGQEYAQYYFEDGSHPALKGLVDMNEAIYEFYSQVQE